MLDAHEGHCSDAFVPATWRFHDWPEPIRFANVESFAAFLRDSGCFPATSHRSWFKKNTGSISLMCSRMQSKRTNHLASPSSGTMSNSLAHSAATVWQERNELCSEAADVSCLDPHVALSCEVHDKTFATDEERLHAANLVDGVLNAPSNATTWPVSTVMVCPG